MPKRTKEEIEDLKVGEALAAMTRTEGWTILKGIIERMVEKKIYDALRPLGLEAQTPDGTVFKVENALNGLLLGEAHKGAIMALRHLLSLVETTIAESDRIRKASGEDDDD